MLQILYKYLILNRKAGIPGIGVFHIHRLPATLDFANKTFISPLEEVNFTGGATAADKKFYSFLAKEQQIDEAEAISGFCAFATTLKENLQAKGSVDLPGLGVLSKDASGVLQFDPAKTLPSFFQNVAAERTIRELPDEEMLAADNKITSNEVNGVEGEEVEGSSAKKDYWWLIALILAAGAIASIIYYYYQNGSFR